jgi:hypothetical protein
MFFARRSMVARVAATQVTMSERSHRTVHRRALAWAERACAACGVRRRALRSGTSTSSRPVYENFHRLRLLHLRIDFLYQVDAPCGDQHSEDARSAGFRCSSS